MQTLVSLLPEPASHRVSDIWAEMQTLCGQKISHSIPYPHFSWAAGDNFPQKPLSAAISEFSRLVEPFTVYATGLAIFPGQSPTLYIPIVKTERLYNFHLQIWRRLDDFGNQLNSNYQPDTWVPHIPLTCGVLSKEALNKILRKLAFEEINLKMEINSLSFFDGKGEMKFSYPFGQTGSSNKS